MLCFSEYSSPIGKITIASDGKAITELKLSGQSASENFFSAPVCKNDPPVIADTKRWLDIYFSGKKPGFLPELSPCGTSFQTEVWNLLLQIPYGETTTYGALAAEIAKRRGKSRMSARAVGSAVGRNPISIIIPCHRVIGADGNLTGYNGGINYIIYLLELEGARPSEIFVP